MPRNVAAAPVGCAAGRAAGGAALGADWARWRLGAGLRPAADGRGGTGLFTRTALARSSSAALSPWVHWQASPDGQAPSLLQFLHILMRLGARSPDEARELGEEAGESKRAGRDCDRGLSEERRFMACCSSSLAAGARAR